MENIITRYRNVSVLVAVLFAQVLLLGVQVKRNEENRSTRLIRVWTIDAITPFEKIIVRAQTGTVNLWHEYFYLRGVRQENRELKQQIERMQLEQVRLNNDAEQSRRLQALMGFKEQFISHTVAAQVIGSSGSERSRVIYIDKVAKDGIDKDMPVITADGVVGKVLNVFRSSSQVLLIDDQTSGVGTILEQSRLQGVLEGTPTGEIILDKIMNDEQVQPGEKVLTSGGDGIFPKGLLIGTVAEAVHGPESFLSIKVKPAANLGRLEEVLVITQKEEIEPNVAGTNSRAVDILAQRLPSVPDKPPPSTDNDSKDKKDQPSVVPSAEAAAQAVAAPTLAKKPTAIGSVSAASNPATNNSGKNPAPAKPLPREETAPDSFSVVKSAAGTSPAQKKISAPSKPPIIQPQPQSAPATRQNQPQ